MKLYIGQDAYRCTEPRNGDGLVHVLGHQFGPALLVVGCTAAQALDVLDEFFGTPVDPDDLDLRDYGDTYDQALDAAVAAGDARYSDSGPVWVDHYEWIQTFSSPREAGAWIRTMTSQKMEVIR